MRKAARNTRSWCSRNRPSRSRIETGAGSDGGSDFAPGITLNRVAFNATLTSLLTLFASSSKGINALGADSLTDGSIQNRKLTWIAEALGAKFDRAEDDHIKTHGKIQKAQMFIETLASPFYLLCAFCVLPCAFCGESRVDLIWLDSGGQLRAVRTPLNRHTTLGHRNSTARVSGTICQIVPLTRALLNPIHVF